LSRVWALVPVAVSLGLLAHPRLATADVMPPERLTNWNPGIPGGIPNYTTVCATVNASDYGNGAVDATAGIQAAIDGCPVGQVVLVDQITDDSYVYWGTDPAAQPGGPARGWFTRYDRPVGQMVEIASISGTTVTFTTALHISLDMAHTAQLTRWTIPY